MSVNLNLSFEIHDIQEIHSSGDGKREEIYAAAKAFLDGEGILDDDMIVDFLAQESYLAGYTTYPVIISRSYAWIPDVTKRWEEMAARILGPTCRAFVNVEYPDEED